MVKYTPYEKPVTIPPVSKYCDNELTMVYIQFKCNIPLDNQTKRQHVAIFVIALFAIVSAMFLLVIYYKLQIMNLEF